MQPDSTTFTFAALLTLVPALELSAQGLIKDIHPGFKSISGSSSPSEFAIMGGKAYFAAYDGNRGDSVGNELFVTDGTEAGTHLVKDVFPGNSSNPRHLTAVGSTLYFAATDGEHYTELWKSDGTPEGTMMVKDIYPGYGNPNYASHPRDLTPLGSTLYFTAYDSTSSRELWKSDGTWAGTVMVKDIYPGRSSGQPTSLVVMDGKLYFAAQDKANNSELWQSDGTAAGTVKVKEINPTGASSPTDLYAAAKTLYFRASDGAKGYELWKSDGTAAGTVMVRDISPGLGSSSPDGFTAVGADVYFKANDGSKGSELWKTGPTGTSLVRDIYVGSLSSSPRELLAFGGKLYFQAAFGTGSSWSRGLFVSDGTQAGTTLVRDTAGVVGLIAAGQTMYFTSLEGRDPTFDVLWKSDGTALGTVKGRSFNRSAGGARTRIALGNTLLLVAGHAFWGVELWKTDGSPGTPVMIKDINTPGPESSRPRYLVELGGITYFSAEDTISGRELWRSNGTEAGTYMVKDIHPGAFKPGSPKSGDPRELAVVGSTLFFSATDAIFTGYPSSNNYELWKTNGTAGGTVLVKDIYPGLRYSSGPHNLCNVGGTLYFAATDAPGNTELWLSDGSDPGTRMVKDISPGLKNGSRPQELTPMGKTLFFTANDGTHYRELWKTNGTLAGTFMVKDIHPTGNSMPTDLTVLGSRIYFKANDGTNGYELWRSDGTAAGTLMVKDIVSGSGSGMPSGLTVMGNALYFMAYQPIIGYELWKSDGTQAGTALFKDLLPGGSSRYPSSSLPQDLTVVGNTLYFTTTAAPNLPARPHDLLWKSDGTQAGTVLVKKFDSWNKSVPAVREPTAVGNSLYFVIGSDGYGAELWTTDGSAVGTRIAADLRPGPLGSLVGNLFYGSGKLLYTADDGMSGVELFGLGTGAVAAPIGVGCSAAYPPPELSATPPALNSTLTMSVSQAKPKTEGALFLGLVGNPTYIGNGCTIYFATTLFLNIGPFTTDTVGRASISMKIPNIPNSIGETYIIQAIISPTGNPPMGMDFTNGLSLTIGR